MFAPTLIFRRIILTTLLLISSFLLSPLPNFLLLETSQCRLLSQAELVRLMEILSFPFRPLYPAISFWNSLLPFGIG